MAELTQTKEVVAAVVTAVRKAIALADGGVQPGEITSGIADAELRQALDTAIAGADQIEAELRGVIGGNWQAGADLLAYIAEQVQTLGGE